MHLTLRQAEQRVHASKSTILRAIRSGKLSAEREGPDGTYRIVPAELFRVFPPKSDGSPSVAEDEVGEGAPAEAVTLARLVAENEKLAVLLEVERRRGEELRVDRDAWKGPAERLSLTHAPAPPAPVAEPPEKPAQVDAGRPNLLERLGRALRG